MKSSYIFCFIIYLIFSCTQNSKEQIPDYKKGMVENVDMQINYLNDYLADNEKDDEALYKLSRLYLKKNDTENAYINIQKAIEINNNDGKYYFILSTCYLKKGLYQDALDYIQRAVSNEIPRNQYIELASDIYFKNQDYKKSLEFLEKMSLDSPDNPYLFWKKGHIYKILKDTANAILNFRNAIKVDSSFTKAYMDLAEIKNKKLEHEEASFLMKKALKFDTTNADLYFNLALAQRKLDIKDSAIFFYEKTLQYDSSNTKALYSLAGLYQQLKKYKKAEKYFRIIQKKNPADKELSTKIGLMLAYQHKYEEALIYFQNIDSSDINYNFVQSYSKKIKADLKPKIIKPKIDTTHNAVPKN